MTIRNFNQETFLDFEDDSSGLDFMVNPDSAELAKDPAAFISNADANLDRHILSNGLINTWVFDDINPIDLNNFPKSQTLENALSALYFYLNNEEQKAKDIYHYYLSQIPALFAPGQDQIFDWVNPKNNLKGNTKALSTAYLLYSVCYYQSQTKNTQFRQLALFCAQQLIDLKSTNNNLIRDDYSTIRCSMEANTIAYLGLKLLFPFTNRSDIKEFTDLLRNDIVNVLGIKAHTLTTSPTANSLVFVSLFALHIGDKFLLKSAKTFLKDFYTYEGQRVLGIGASAFDFKLTAVSAILFFRNRQKSISYSFNSSILEHFETNQSFNSTNDSSFAEQLLWFLLLNKVIESSFEAEELFR